MKKDILNGLKDIQQLSKNKKFDEALIILDKLLEKYPYSSELLMQKIVMSQLVDEWWFSFEEIEKTLQFILKLNKNNLDWYLELVAFEYFIMNNKDKSEKNLNEWFKKLNQFLKNYLWIYFDYLSENNQIWQIEEIKSQLIKNIKEIPNEYHYTNEN